MKHHNYSYLKSRKINALEQIIYNVTALVVMQQSLLWSESKSLSGTLIESDASDGRSERGVIHIGGGLERGGAN